MNDLERKLYFRDLDSTLRTCIEVSKYAIDSSNKIAFKTLKRQIKIAQSILREIEAKS